MKVVRTNDETRNSEPKTGNLFPFNPFLVFSIRANSPMGRGML